MKPKKKAKLFLKKETISHLNKEQMVNANGGAQAHMTTSWFDCETICITVYDTWCNTESLNNPTCYCDSIGCESLYHTYCMCQ